jgi:hypothetical protein
MMTVASWGVGVTLGRSRIQVRSVIVFTGARIAGAYAVRRASAHFVTDSAAPIYGIASFLKREFSGELQIRELPGPMINGDGPFGVLYKRVIALPMPMRLLMHLHFDLDSFVDSLNHCTLLRRIQQPTCSKRSKVMSRAASIFP